MSREVVGVEEGVIWIGVVSWVSANMVGWNINVFRLWQHAHVEMKLRLFSAGKLNAIAKQQLLYYKEPSNLSTRLFLQSYQDDVNDFIIHSWLYYNQHPTKTCSLSIICNCIISTQLCSDGLSLMKTVWEQINIVTILKFCQVKVQ